MSLSNLTHLWVEVRPFSDLAALLPDHVTVSHWASPDDDPVESALPAQAILASSRIQYDGDFLDRLPNLRIIARTGIGYDNVDLDAATQRNVVVTNAPDGPTQSTAEHTVTLLLAVAKRLKEADANLAQGNWGPRSDLTSTEVAGKTLGLIGLGRIGRKVAQMCSAGLGMRVIAHDPFVSDEQARELGVALCELDSLLAQSDFVSVHVPSTPETYHLMNAERIAHMKDGAHLLNLARGPLVDPAALLDAVDSGKLAGAGLDVFEPEPPPADSPLRRHPRILVTPHTAAITADSRVRLERMAVERVLQLFRGERPQDVVNPAVLD